MYALKGLVVVIGLVNLIGGVAFAAPWHVALGIVCLAAGVLS